MTQRTSTFIGVSLLTILSVAGVFIGHVYFNIPMEVIPPFFGLLGIVLVGIKKVFFKGELNPPPQPTKKDKLRASLALCAGLSAFAFIVGLMIYAEVFNYFEKTGKPIPIYKINTFFIGLFVAITVVYAKKRASIIRRQSNNATTPDKRVSG